MILHPLFVLRLRFRICVIDNSAILYQYYRDAADRIQVAKGYSLELILHSAA